MATEATADPIPGETVVDASSVNKAQSYQIPTLRPPQHVADIGRDSSALYHIFGNDMTRRNNLHFIDDDVIIYASAAAIVFQNTSTGKKDYLLSIDDGGVGCVAVHPSRFFFAVGGRGHRPNIYIYNYPSMEVSVTVRTSFSVIAFSVSLRYIESY